MLGGSRWSHRFLLLLSPTHTRLRTAVAQRLGALQEAGASLTALRGEMLQILRGQGHNRLEEHDALPLEL